MADFGDLFGQYIDKRINNATEPFTNPGDYLSNRIGASFGNTGTEAQVNGGAVAPAQPQPRIVPEGSTINLGASNQPPVPVQPVAPAAAPTNIQTSPAAVPAPTAPVAPAMPGQMPPGMTTNLGNTGTAPVPVQSVAPLGLDRNEQVVPEQQLPPARPAPTAAVQPQANNAQVNTNIGPTNMGTAGTNTTPVNTAPPAAAPSPVGNQEIYDLIHSGDPKKYAHLAYDKSQPEAVQNSAKNQLYNDIKHEEERKKAETTVNNYLQNGDVNGILKDLNPRGKSEEGSYIKAYLYARLGLNDLAQQEQEKISPSKTTMPVMIGNEHYAATYNKNGELISARNERGEEVDSTTLNKIAANGFASKGATTGQSFMKDSDGNIWSHTITPGTNRVIWTNQNTGATSTTAPAGLTPFGQVNPITKANIAILQSKIKKMESDNVEAARTNSTPPHSTAEINALKEALTGGGGTYETAPVSGNVAPTTTAPTSEASKVVATLPSGARVNAEQKTLADAGVPIISGIRTDEDQAKLRHHQVNGQWFTKEGLPVAENNTHKNGTNIDVDINKMTPELEKYLHSQGWNNPLPNDPGHWIKGNVKPTTTTPATTPTTTPTTTPVEGKWSTPEANSVAKRNPTAEAIAEYRTKPPTATGRSGAGAAALMNDVRKINPDFTEQKYEVAKKERDDYTKVNPASSGGQLQAINRAIPHLDQYKRAVDALNNGDMPLFNKIANQYQINVGNDKVAGAKAIQGLVSTEVQKAVAGGLGGVEERKDLANQMSTSLNPKQLANVIDQYQGLITAQGVGLRQKWTANGLPGKEWDEKLVPAARDAMLKHEKKDNNQRSKW